MRLGWSSPKSFRQKNNDNMNQHSSALISCFVWASKAEIKYRNRWANELPGLPFLFAWLFCLLLLLLSRIWFGFHRIVQHKHIDIDNKEHRFAEVNWFAKLCGQNRTLHHHHPSSSLLLLLLLVVLLLSFHWSAIKCENCVSVHKSGKTLEESKAARICFAIVLLVCIRKHFAK